MATVRVILHKIIILRVMSKKIGDIQYVEEFDHIFMQNIFLIFLGSTACVFHLPFL